MRGQQKILIADDSAMNRSLLREMLGKDYDILEAENGRETIEILQENPLVDLILLDVVMPEMDGFEVLETMKRYHWIEEIPVIMISSEEPASYAERAYDLGAVDFIRRPFETILVRHRVINTLLLYAKQKQLSAMVSEQIYENEKNSNLMVNILSHIVEFRNGESGLHVLHIQKATALLLQELLRRTDGYGITAADISVISTASALHDIGKIDIPGEILNKPGKLTAEEYEIMKQHSMIGARIIDELPIQREDEPLIHYAYEICRWHHERYDGGGYPDHLKGDDIPMAAQIVSLADVYDALTSVRCYKKAYSHQEALRMILAGECGSFNPVLLDCLIAVNEDLQRLLLQQNTAQQSYLSYARQASEKLIRNKDIPGQNRLQSLLTSEEEKHHFLSARSSGIVCEYDVKTRLLKISGRMASRLSDTRRLQLPEENDKLHIEPSELLRFHSVLMETSAESPDAELLLPLQDKRELDWYHVHLHTIWNHAVPAVCTGAIALFDSVQNKLLTNAAEDINITTGKGLLQLMRNLRGIFDVVRIVDVEKAEVLELDENGEISCTKHACYQVWSKEHRCENCISARALIEKSQLTKLEFTADHHVFQVISKYLELEDRKLVLELVVELKDEVLLGSWTRETIFNRITEYTKGLYRDSLTGAYNRRYLMEQLAGLRTQAGIAMLDIDNFKQVNDRYGHLAGDDVLQAAAKVVMQNIQPSDSLVRYGGDEFLLICGDTDAESFNQRLLLIREKMAGLRLSACPDFCFTVSIGGVYGKLTASEAIREADFRMYRAKASRNAVYVEHKL